MRAHCCGHKSSARAHKICCGHKVCVRDKNVSDFFQKHVASATNVSRFAQHRNNLEQQRARNNVSLFATAFRFNTSIPGCNFGINRLERFY